MRRGPGEREKEKKIQIFYLLKNLLTVLLKMPM